MVVLEAVEVLQLLLVLVKQQVAQVERKATLLAVAVRVVQVLLVLLER